MDASLQGASFASASLGAAKTTCCGGGGDLIFKNADLRNAKFEDASLLVDNYYADIDFRDADLRGATFEDASLYASSYGNIDFGGATAEAPDTIVTGMQIGLATTRPRAPPAVGTHMPGNIWNADGDCYVGSAKDGCNQVPLEDFLSDDDD